MGPGVPSWIGQTIEGYQIDRRVGSGLTGDVYHAVSPVLDPPEVAIKILNVSRELTTKQYQEFFAAFSRKPRYCSACAIRIS